MNIGVLGGTFDPIHNGHLIIAKHARKKLALQRVIFIPAGQPWLKVDNREITDAHHRVKMVELAIKGLPCFELSNYEINHPGPSYSIDTIIALKKRLGNDADLYLLVGWDSLLELPRWHKPEELVKICKLAAITRGSGKPPDIDTLEKEVPGIKQSTILLNMKRVDISSTDIRNRVVQGLSIKGMVPDPVADYIREQRLYR